MARACRDDLPDGQNGIFFRRGLDSANQIERLREIKFYAQKPGICFGAQRVRKRCREQKPPLLVDRYHEGMAEFSQPLGEVPFPM